jgi:GNAT superfamily N-acetyltransferase
MITIREVSGKKGTDEFIEVTWKIYPKLIDEKKPDPKWVAPLKIAVYENLDTEKNPFYKRAKIQLFIAEKNGKTVGRIAAIDNQAHTEFHQDRVGFYGFFECIDDLEVSTALFDRAESWLKERGFLIMRGPMNPSTNHECGLLIRGQSQHPTTMTTWNPKYYESLHEQNRFVKAQDLVAYILPIEKVDALPPKVYAYANRIRKNSRIQFRDFDLKNFASEIEKCFEIYNSAWEKNWGFFPMTREEFEFAAKDMKMILDKRMAFMAEIDGKAAGFMLAVPDINQVLKYNKSGGTVGGVASILLGKKFIKLVRIITLGVKPEHRGGGIFALFTVEAFERAKKFGYLAGEASWILEDNEPMNKPWRDMGAPAYRLWRIYDRAIQ